MFISKFMVEWLLVKDKDLCLREQTRSGISSMGAYIDQSKPPKSNLLPLKV